jgi:hypothetical protein
VRAVEVLSCDPPARAPDWEAIDWTDTERDNFSFFRQHSDEPAVLTEATMRAALASRVDPSTATTLDFGSDGGELSDCLRKRFKRYVAMPIDGHASAERQLAALRSGSGRALFFDICVISHVLPYVMDAGSIVRAIASRASPRGIGIAILLDASGDQHEIGRLARIYDPCYPRKHDHGARFAAFLGAHEVPFNSFVVTSQSRAASPGDLARLLAFFLGDGRRELIAQVGASIPAGDDGVYRLTSRHRVFTWRLRHFSSGASAA